MKTKLLLCIISLFSIMIFSCKKSTDKNDLTTDIVGHYTKASENTDIIVNKVSNNKVSISFSTGTGSGEYALAFTDVTMNSATTFTLNTVTKTGMGNTVYYCEGTESISGTGTYSNGNISIALNTVGSGGTTYPCSDWTDLITGSK